MKRPSWPTILVSAAVLAVLWFFLFPANGSPRSGKPAPLFTLTDLSGRAVSLSDYRGRVVLLDFWATWCDACQVEIPALKELYRNRNKERFELLAAAVDQGDASEVARFAQAQALPYPVLLADYSTARAYGLSGIPTKFLIGPDGILRRRYVGEADPGELAADIQALLETKP